MEKTLKKADKYCIVGLRNQTLRMQKGLRNGNGIKEW